MNRTDRLYAIVEELRAVAPRSRTARELSERYEVSVRTVERDISALQRAGVPVYATPDRRGGYALGEATTLRPLNVTPREATARVESRVPPPTVIEDAIADRLVLHIDYSDRTGTVSRRAVEPVAVVANGPRWYLVAWCRLRGEARAFRTDRIIRAFATGERADPRHVEDAATWIPDFVALRRAPNDARGPS